MWDKATWLILVRAEMLWYLPVASSRFCGGRKTELYIKKWNQFVSELIIFLVN